MAATSDVRVSTGASNAPIGSHAPTQRIPELDGVRGLAIALVLIYHYSGGGVPANKVLYYAVLPTHLMWSGVDLFFVLSGLLIGGYCSITENRQAISRFSMHGASFASSRFTT
jgi:peptidoglycan/LPS O-acetylase OafA/YrhL